MARYVADSPDLRLLKPAFMQIRQALATGHDRTEGTVAFLQNTLESLKTNGFVTDALARSGQDASVASPA
jgi:polar amino acid transport system substrate-binding protein